MRSRNAVKSFCVTGVLLFLAATAFAQQPDLTKHRLLMLADMGNEPDEEQQNIHLLVCSNEIDIEGLIAVTGKYLRKDPRPDLYFKLVDAYEKVVPNLRLHANDWPSPEYLRSIVKAGQTNYGMDDVGPGKSSTGSNLIIAAVTKPDSRPIWIVVNAGSNTLAQALWDYRATHTRAEVDAFVAKLRVFENGAQDNAGAWICHNFPGIFWIRSNYQTYAFGGLGLENGPYVWEPYAETAVGQHEWLKEHVRTNHGALGDIYPERRFRDGDGSLQSIEGGGTIPWLGLVSRGLSDIDHPSWGGWSGRFTEKPLADVWSRHRDVKVDEEKLSPFYAYRDVSDSWTDPETGKSYSGDNVPVWRWRRAMYNDLIARMDWCVKSFKEANHHPIAAFRSDTSRTIVRLKAQAGDVVPLEASASTDPDGDPLVFSWWVYPEAGTYSGQIAIQGQDLPTASIKIPSGAMGKQIHVILEVKDRNKVAQLFAYRRIVIDVSESFIEKETVEK